MKYHVVSFATPQYGHFLDGLAAQCANLMLPFHGVRLPCSGSFRANTQLKPRAILKALDLLCTPVLYLDSDSSIINIPNTNLFQEEWDVGTLLNPHQGHRTRIAAQAIWFNSTVKSTSFLKHWADKCLATNRLDHPVFAQAIIDFAGTSLRVFDASASLAGCVLCDGQIPSRTHWKF